MEGKNYYENVYNYKDFNNIDLDIFINMFYYLQFYEIMKTNENMKKQLIVKIKFLISIIIEYEKIIISVKEIDCNIKDKLQLIKTYNQKYVNSFQSVSQINYISIVDIEKESQINPYCKAINFIKDIILNLKEESRLFEIFLYLDSNVIENLLIEREDFSILWYFWK